MIRYFHRLSKGGRSKGARSSLAAPAPAIPKPAARRFARRRTEPDQVRTQYDQELSVSDRCRAGFRKTIPNVSRSLGIRGRSESDLRPRRQCLPKAEESSSARIFIAPRPKNRDVSLSTALLEAKPFRPRGHISGNRSPTRLRNPSPLKLIFENQAAKFIAVIEADKIE